MMGRDRSFAFTGRKLWLCVGGAAVALTLGAAAIQADRLGARAGYRDGDPVVRVYALDQAGVQTNPDQLAASIRDAEADIVVISGLDPAAFDDLERITAGFRYSVSSARTAQGRDVDHALIASRYALVGREASSTGSGETLGTLARTPLGRIDITLISGTASLQALT